MVPLTSSRNAAGDVTKLKMLEAVPESELALLEEKLETETEAVTGATKSAEASVVASGGSAQASEAAAAAKAPDGSAQASGSSGNPAGPAPSRSAAAQASELDAKLESAVNADVAMHMAEAIQPFQSIPLRPDGLPCQSHSFWLKAEGCLEPYSNRDHFCLFSEPPDASLRVANSSWEALQNLKENAAVLAEHTVPVVQLQEQLWSSGDSGRDRFWLGCWLGKAPFFLQFGWAGGRWAVRLV